MCVFFSSQHFTDIIVIRINSRPHNQQPHKVKVKAKVKPISKESVRTWTVIGNESINMVTLPFQENGDAIHKDLRMLIKFFLFLQRIFQSSSLDFSSSSSISHLKNLYCFCLSVHLSFIYLVFFSFSRFLFSFFSFG